MRLTNGLRTLLSLAPQPSVAQLKELFEATYEANHRGRAETVVSLSGVVTRYEAQDTWYLKMASRWVSPYIPDGRKADLYAAFSRAFEKQYAGDRIPLQLGFHFVEMNGGAYWRALDRLVSDVCHRKDVACVSYSEAIPLIKARGPLKATPASGL